jgi:hypothetical protein
MKKIILFVSVVSAISLASCTKDRTCTCTTVTNPGGNSTTSAVTYTKARKGDAMSHCLNATSTQEFLGTTYTATRTCTLK